MSDRRYTHVGCYCRDAWCSGCGDPDLVADQRAGMRETERLSPDPVALRARRGRYYEARWKSRT